MIDEHIDPPLAVEVKVYPEDDLEIATINALSQLMHTLGWHHGTNGQARNRIAEWFYDRYKMREVQNENDAT